MQCRDISQRDFVAIAAELRDVEVRDGSVETLRGTHDLYGFTLLLRDATRCLVLVEDPSGLDRALLLRAFNDDVASPVHKAPVGPS